MQQDGQKRLLRPGDQHWEKCARHQNSSTTRFVANFFLCDDCSDRLQHEAFNGRSPLFEGLHVEGYCGLCNELTATDLRQWFVCPICVNVVLSYPKGFAASRYVHDFWAHEVTPRFPELVLEELDEVKLEPFVPGKRSAKKKGEVAQALDYRVGRRRGDLTEALFSIELKAGPASIAAMSEFQLDVNDFNDIANGCNGCGLPAYVFQCRSMTITCRRPGAASRKTCGGQTCGLWMRHAKLCVSAGARTSVLVTTSHQRFELARRSCRNCALKATQASGNASALTRSR